MPARRPPPTPHHPHAGHRGDEEGDDDRRAPPEDVAAGEERERARGRSAHDDAERERFRACLERLLAISLANDAAKARGGIAGLLKRIGCGAAAAVTFLRLYTLPVTPNELPQNVRLAPTW